VLGRFTYLWEQALYDPVSGRLVCHIHFAFEDGSRLERAFSYDWRLWSLPEIRELLDGGRLLPGPCVLAGVGLRTGSPDGRFAPVESGVADAGWIAYLTAEP
jgi:hypothetical protein